jgi:DNA polymerase-3 subunit chi
VTEVEFHTGIADPADFACRLLRKAYRRGARVLVTASAPRLVQLDRLLWTFDERDFIPHLRLPAAGLATAAMAAMASRTPIWLAEPPLPGAAPGIVVNLGARAPDRLDVVQRLIEVVGTDPEEVQGGRERWRAYKACLLYTSPSPRDRG